MVFHLWPFSHYSPHTHKHLFHAEVERFANTTDALGRSGQLRAQGLDSSPANLLAWLWAHACVGGQEDKGALSTAQLNKWDEVL